MPRLVGKSGSVYFTIDSSASKIADIFDIILELNQELLDSTIKFEVHDTFQAAGVTSRLTCQRYITDTATARTGANWVGGGVIGGELIANIPASGNAYKGLTVQWEFWTVDQSVAAKGFKVSGEGFIERVTMNNPRGMATEVWEIRNTAMPTVIN